MSAPVSIDLQAFCSQDETRPKLLTPWFDPASGYTIATDGRLMVCLLERPDTVLIAHDRPSVVRIVQQWSEDIARAPLPALPPEIIEKCTVCEGAKTTRCAHCGHEHCCEACDGEASWSFNRPVQIDGTWFGETYVRKLEQLPNVQFEIAPRCVIEGWHIGARFSFDGGFGFLMPRAAPDEREPSAQQAIVLRSRP